MTKPRILFLCTGNSCRSQMGEAWVRQLHPEAYQACSAGTAPKGLDPRAAAVMAEVGVDLSGATSNHVDEVVAEGVDVVVAVCDLAAESCPALVGVPVVLRAPFPDPPAEAAGLEDEEQALAIYRRVRDQIRAYVADLPAHLASAQPPP